MEVAIHDYPLPAYEGNKLPFKYTYWHNKRELGWGNCFFMDGHVTYTKATYNSPRWYYGVDYTFAYNSDKLFAATPTLPRPPWYE